MEISEIPSSTYKSNLNEKPSRKKQVLSQVVKTMIELSIKDPTRKFSAVKFATYCASLVYLSLNILSLTLPVEDSSEGYEVLSIVLSNLRLDYLMQQINMQEAFYWVSFVTTCIPAAAFTLYLHFKKLPVLKVVFQKSRFLVERVFVVPFSVSLVTGISNNLGSNSDGNYALGVFCLVGFFFLLLEVLVFSLLMYENSLINHKLHFFGVGSNFVNKLYICSNLGSVVLYCFTENTGLKFFQVFGYGLSGFVIMQTLPFYCEVANFMFGFVCIVNSFGALAFVVGKALGNMDVCCLLVVVVTPVIGVLLYALNSKYYNRTPEKPWKFCLWKINLWLRLKVNEFESIENSDLKLPEKKAQKEAVLKEVKKLYKALTTDYRDFKILFVWEALVYLAFKMQNEASLKLAKSNKSSFSLDADFQCLRLDKVIRSNNKTPQKYYIKYLNQITKAKKLDKNCCYCILDLCNELFSDQAKPKTLETSLINLTELIKETNRTYNECVKKYNVSEALISYGSFLTEIMHDPFGKQYFFRGIQESKAKAQKDLSVFEKGLGVLVLANPSRYSPSISMYNSIANDLLCIKECFDLRVKNFLPKAIASLVKSELVEVAEFGKKCTKLETCLEFLVDAKGMLLDVDVKVDYGSWNQKVFFTFLLRPRNSSVRILLDENLSVVAHTESLNDMLCPIGNFRDNNYAGNYVGSILPGLDKEFQKDLISINSEFLGTNLKYLTFSKRTLNLGRKFYELVLELQEDIIITAYRQEDNQEMLTPLSKTVQFSEDQMSEIDRKKYTHLSVVNSGSQSSRNQKLEARGNSLNSIMSLGNSKLISDQTVSQQIELLRKKTKRFKWFTFLVILVEILALTVTVVILIGLITSFEDISFLEEVDRTRYLVTDIGVQARTINLVSLNYVPKERKDSASNKLRKDVSEVSQLLQSLDSELLSLEDKVRYPFWNPVVPVWELRAGDPVESKVSIYRAIEKLVFAGESVLGGNYNMNESSMFFLYRNANTEIFRHLNTSMFDIVRSSMVQRRETVMNLNLMIIVSGIIVVLGSVFILIPNIVALDRMFGSIWNYFTGLDAKSANELRQGVINRLETEHSEEDTFNWNPRKKPKLPHPKQHLRFLLKVSLFPLLCLGFLLVIYFVNSYRLEKLLATVPNFINWAGIRSPLAVSSFFWLREHKLVDLPQGYYKVVPQGQSATSPRNQVSDLIETLITATQTLNNVNENQGIYVSGLNTKYSNFMYKSACEVFEESKCLLKHFEKGLYSAILEFEKSMHYATNTQESWNYLEKFSEEIVFALRKTLDYYNETMLEELSQIKIVYIYMFCSVVFLSIILFLLSYLPMINKFHQKVSKLAGLSKVFEKNLYE